MGALRYDVFLSFRGEDARRYFTDFLYNSLVADGIYVFTDDDHLRFDEPMGSELLEIIRNSKIHIPLITAEYACSTWCLRELAQMMDCHKKHGQSVFPIFYEVDVVDVDRQRGKFEEALREHERKHSSQEVLKWREALTSVARIRGWTSEAIANGREVKLVDMVRRKVSSELRRMRIERLPMIIRSVFLHLSEKKWTENDSQVFLAFRGPDTRYGLAAYLYTSLVAAGIRVFNDDDPSLIGKDVAREIRNAIDHSIISIPILSENYTSSRWCLDDLAQIVDCKRTKGQKILPIFYKVKPSQMQDASHCLRLQLKDLEDESTYERWERAMREVGSCKGGWESDQIADGHEGVLVKQVVQEVSRLLTNPQKHDPQSLSTEY